MAQRKDLKIKSVAMGRTINSGNYSSVRIDLAADVGPGDDWRDVRARLDELLDVEELRVRKGVK